MNFFCNKSCPFGEFFDMGSLVASTVLSKLELVKISFFVARFIPSPPEMKLLLFCWLLSLFLF